MWLEADVLFYPALDNSVDSIGADTIWNDFGIKGEGTTIAILDTGVDFDHESLDDLDDNPNTDDPKIAVDLDGMLAFYNANTDKEYPDELQFLYVLLILGDIQYRNIPKMLPQVRSKVIPLYYQA